MRKLSIGIITVAAMLSLSACHRDTTTSESARPPRTAQAPEVITPAQRDASTQKPAYRDPSIPPNPPENQPKDPSVLPPDQK